MLTHSIKYTKLADSLEKLNFFCYLTPRILKQISYFIQIIDLNIHYFAVKQGTPVLGVFIIKEGIFEIIKDIDANSKGHKFNKLPRSESENSSLINRKA